MLYENNMKALYTKLAVTGLFEVVSEGHYHMLKSPTTCVGLNMVFGNLTAYGLATARHLFQESPFSCIINSNDQTTEQLLTTNGYQHQTTMPEMMLDLATYQPITQTALTIMTVNTFAQMQQWCDILATTFDIPLESIYQYSKPLFDLKTHVQTSGIEMLLGFFNALPAVTALIHYDAQVACVSSMAVLPLFQRQGLGRAMLDACLDYAQQQNAQQAILVSTAAGQPFYKKLGFQITRPLKIFSRDI